MKVKKIVRRGTPDRKTGSGYEEKALRAWIAALEGLPHCSRTALHRHFSSTTVSSAISSSGVAPDSGSTTFFLRRQRAVCHLSRPAPGAGMALVGFAAVWAGDRRGLGPLAARSLHDHRQLAVADVDGGPTKYVQLIFSIMFLSCGTNSHGFCPVRVWLTLLWQSEPAK
ncbi:MAG: hypothetical protein M9927_02555 [Anaerolineae bacterium]|nr:hypothetical protein [Anaerolineae bacterium]